MGGGQTWGSRVGLRKWAGGVGHAQGYPLHSNKAWLCVHRLQSSRLRFQGKEGLRQLPRLQTLPTKLKS